MTTVLLATRSAGKVRELRAWLQARGVACETLDEAAIAYTPSEELLEVHDTFEANAVAKAQWFHEVSGGRVVVAEDSGLEVEALDGAPGVHSKRWSGADDGTGRDVDARNNALLLRRLDEAAAQGRPGRRARYVCAAAVVWSGGSCVVRGTTEGEIVRRAEGRGGFGYDPYFLSDDLQATFGAVSPEEKSRVSHRGRALAALMDQCGAVPW